MHPQYNPEFHSYFDSRIIICPMTGCWLWRLFVDTNGYGKSKLNGKTVLTHRRAYQTAYGTIPECLQVNHKCEHLYVIGDFTYRRCCNPQHLTLGTQAENMVDMKKSGRAAVGTRHRAAKLTDREVTLIRQVYHLGFMEVKPLSQHFHISINHMYRIVNNKAWTHLDKI